MPTSLRLLSVDAQAFSGDRAALARAMSMAAPDVVCVHSSPHLLRWRSISAALARRAGLVVVGGGRPAGANLLLSTLRVDVDAVRDLSFTGHRCTRAGAALAALHVGACGFVVTSATLARDAAERRAQAGELQSALDRLVPGERPVIISVAGVEHPDGAARHPLAEDRVAVAGGICVDRRIAVSAVSEPPAATDRMVLVDLALP